MNESSRSACEQLLHALSSPPPLREDFFQAPTFKLVSAVCEFSLNVLYGELALTEDDKAVLKRHKTLLEKLADEKLKYNKKVQLLKLAEPELLDILRDILKRYV